MNPRDWTGIRFPLSVAGQAELGFSLASKRPLLLDESISGFSANAPASYFSLEPTSLSPATLGDAHCARDCATSWIATSDQPAYHALAIFGRDILRELELSLEHF